MIATQGNGNKFDKGEVSKMAGNNSLQLCRGTSEAISSLTEISLEGQPIYSTDTKALYIGDGITPVNQLQPIIAVYVQDGYLHINTNYTPPSGD